MPRSDHIRQRAVRRVFVPSTIVALAALAAASTVRGHPGSDDFSNLAAKVSPAVVNVSVERKVTARSAGEAIAAADKLRKDDRAVTALLNSRDDANLFVALDLHPA
jgi:S1-C subfamily serine protease